MKRTPLQTKHLWELVDLMKYDPDPEKFDQRWMYAGCGAPACLFGHAERHWRSMDNKDFFGLERWEHEYLFSSNDVLPPYYSRQHDTGSIAASRVIDVIEGGS